MAFYREVPLEPGLRAERTVELGQVDPGRTTGVTSPAAQAGPDLFPGQEKVLQTQDRLIDDALGRKGGLLPVDRTDSVALTAFQTGFPLPGFPGQEGPGKGGEAGDPIPAWGKGPGPSTG